MLIAAHDLQVDSREPLFMRAARDGTASALSASWHEFTGLTEAECASDGWLAAVHPDERAALQRDWHAACAEGERLARSVRIRQQRRGPFLPFALYLAPAGATGEKAAFLHAAFMPIDDAPSAAVTAATATMLAAANDDDRGSLRAEPSPRAVSRSLRLVADALPPIVWSAQASGWLDYFNERWHEYTGTPRSGGALECQARLQLWIEHVHPDDRAAVQSAWRHALATAQPYAVELRCRRHDGVYRWFLARARPLRVGGHVLRWFGTFTDIEEQKQAQLERERLLASERDARAHAERAQRLTEEFVALVSHELRSPLAAVLNWAQLLQRLADRPEAVRNAALSIERNARTQAQLVDDLFDAGRIVFGKMELAREELSVRDLIEAGIATVRHTAQARGIHLRQEISDAPRVRGDAMRLHQVLVNLVGNAVKFTPEGGVVSVHASLQGTQAVIAVADTGCGIAPELLPVIFERFRQADAPDRRPAGLGLGLHIVRSLVELHGGSVEADSAGPGRGSLFTLRLPALGAERERSGPSDADESPSPAPAARSP